jgi:preprotein translocase subunit SecA
MPQEMHFEHAEADNGLAEAESNQGVGQEKNATDESEAPFVREDRKVGRNEP